MKNPSFRSFAICTLLLASGVSQISSASAQQIANIGPTYIDFGAIAVGAEVTVPVTIRNLTASPMSFAGGGISTQNGFRGTTGTCSSPLAAGASCNFNYYFLSRSPSSAPLTNQTSISVTAGGQTRQVGLDFRGSGSGTLLSVAPREIDFGNVLLGQTMAVTVHITNHQNSSVSIAGGGISTPGYTGNLGTCGTSIPAGVSCTMNYSFTPGSLGASAASTSITLQASGTSVSQGYSLSFRGTGIASPNLVTVAPVDMDFGQVKVGRKVTVPVRSFNNGSSTVNFAGGGISNSDGNAFNALLAAGTGCTSSTIAGGATCSINYSFEPREARAHAASTAVSYSRTGAASQHVPLTFTGSGVGTLARVSPSVVDFGKIVIGTTISVPVTVYNDGDLPLSSFIGGGVSPPFSSTTTCTGSLAPGAQCTYTYTFTSTATSQGFREAQTAISFSNSLGMQPATLITLRADGADLIFRNGFDG